MPTQQSIQTQASGVYDAIINDYGAYSRWVAAHPKTAGVLHSVVMYVAGTLTGAWVFRTMWGLL
jgi:hypothetical protein